MSNSKTILSLVGRLIPYYRQNLRILILDLFFAISTSLTDLIFPLVMKSYINLLKKSPPSLMVELFKLGFIYVLILVIELIGTFYTNHIGSCMGAKIETSMRNDLFAHCQKLSVSYYDNNRIGQIMSRLIHDISEIGEFAHNAPEKILVSVMKISVPFIVLLNFKFWLAVVMYGFLIPLLGVIMYYFKKMHVENQRFRKQLGDLNASVEDSLLGIKTIKSYANEEFEYLKFKNQNQKTLEAKTRFYKNFGYIITLNRFTYCFEVLIFLIGTGLLLHNKLLEGATLLIYSKYIDKIMMALYKLINFTEIYQKGLTGVSRFCEIMDLPVESHSNTIHLAPDRVKGEIEFKDVQFSYVSNSRPTLKNFNLKIKPNEKIAIIGASGSGKTTICNLLKNFYKVQKGEILIDGVNINQINPQNLHEIVGFVQQNIYLFTGTILENIRFGKLDATFEEVVEAAKKAKIFNFIDSLENKFNTNIGERGTKLSGGQKQQISIARLFLKNPKILILDEATSSIDSENEKIILDALNELVKNKTAITVTHKLNTIKNADLIYLISNGQIVESGTHNELIKNKNSAYKQFYDNLTT